MRKPTKSFAAMASLVFVTSALAADLPKEGQYAFTACFSGVSKLISFSKGFRGYSYELLGTNRADKTGGIMDHTSFRCVGANTLLGGKRTIDVLCEIKDSDGQATREDRDGRERTANEGGRRRHREVRGNADDGHNRTVQAVPVYRAGHLSGLQPPDGYL